MPRKPVSSTALTFEQKLAIIRALWPLGDRALEYLDAMKAAGFAAFVPREQWIESFAENEKEIEEHREYNREWARYAFGLGMASIDLVNCKYRKVGFPPGLIRLRDIRDKKNNGVPERELYKHFSQGEWYWRIQIDECRRRIDESIYSAARQGLEIKERAAVRAEASVHATDLSRHYSMLTMIIRDRIAFSRAVLDRELGPGGFRLDKKRSRVHAPVFTKAITPEWDLCFELVPDRIFVDATRGWFDSRLVLRSGGDRRAFDPKVHLEIKYFSILEALDAYRQFFSIEELETIILARTFLYKLMAPILEEALRDHLSREFSKTS